MKKLKLKELKPKVQALLSQEQTRTLKGGLDPELGTIINGNGH
ncbi:MAG: hypothetical protein AAFP19_16530 [Bacteroidota bacterium]